MRLHELARELDADSKRLLAIANELGLGVKSHSSALPRGTEGILRAAWQEEVVERARKAESAAATATEQAAAPSTRGELRDIRVTVSVGGATAEAAGPAAPAAPAPAAEPVEEEEAREEEPLPPLQEDEPVPAQAEVQALPAAAPVPLVAAEPPPAASTPVAAPSAEGTREMVVTFGGHPAGGERPPETLEAAAEKTDAGAAGEGREVRAIGVPNVPTRNMQRRGARIVGRIDLPSEEVEPPRRPAPAFDPLDPTRVVPERGRPVHRKATEPAEEARPRARVAKPGETEFVFDPEDNTALSAIRLGHFQGRRRGQPRRPPPPRRSRLASSKRGRKASEKPMHPVSVRAPIGVRELSLELGIKASEILQHFLETFDPRDKNAVLNADQLVALGLALEREITILAQETAEAQLLLQEDQRAAALAGESLPRPPVVAVMGHVDHGKTTLLDKLRNTRVADKEAGGITQKTSAYAVATASGARVTFLDTPGHKAFTEMRARGAQLTDVAVLVVAADDGVMEQTSEAIDHARAAEVPLVVAINKCDRPNANPQRVRQQLASAGVFVEDYGGEVGVVECSALTGQGLDALVERLALETEILELRADPGLPARGIVVDSTKDSKLGVVATVVVHDGTLRPNDTVLAGTAVGRVRWLLDDRGQRIDAAGPSMPVQVFGFEEPPTAGARFLAVADVDLARQVAAERVATAKAKLEVAPADETVTLENLFATLDAQQVTEVNVLLKADNSGSLDVLRQTVESVHHPEVRFKVIRTAVGGISEDDVLLAFASKAFIIGFTVVPDAPARAAIQRTGVEVKYYEVIYEMTDDLEKAIEGRLGTERQEAVIGHVTVRVIFKISRYGTICGCYVTDGLITRDAHVRLVRDGKVVHTGRLDSLKRFKDDVREVRENYECGLHVAGYNDIKEGDVLEAFTVTEVKRTLESAPSTAT